MLKIKYIFLIVLLSLAFVTACQSEQTEGNEGTAVPATEIALEPTDTPEPTPTETPTEKPTDTATPLPTATATSVPTGTPTSQPTETAVPTRRPTATPGSQPDATKENSGDATESETKEDAETVAEGDSEKEEDPIDSTLRESDSELSAEEILQKSSEALNKIDTITQEQNLIVSTSFFTQTQHMICHQDLPDSGYCITEISMQAPGEEPMVIQSFEIVVHDDQYWIRPEGQEAWEELPEDFLEDSGFAEDFEEEYTSALEFLIDPALIGEREIDGLVVYEIHADLSEEMFAVVLNEETAEQFLAEAEDLEMSTTLWIGKEDFITRRQVLNMFLIIEGEAIELENVVINSNINEPVDIPDPTLE